MVNHSRLAENIKLVRKQKCLTQEQLANKSGVATITIRQYEGEKRKPRMEQLEKIAQACGVKTISFFAGVFDD